MPEGIHVWTLNTATIDSRRELEFLGLFQDEERARWTRYTHETTRRNYLAAHGLLRHMLSELYGGAPEAWRIAIGAHGKPHLVEASADIRFNLTHTNGLVAAAATIGIDLGVDAEDLERPVNLSISERVFSDTEIAWLNGQPEDRRKAGFLRLWTIKEAYVKAVGHGLGYGLKNISVVFDPLRLEGIEARCNVHEWQIEQRHLLSLAVARDGEVKLKRFEI